MTHFLPEGYLPGMEPAAAASMSAITDCIRTGRILQGKAVCCDKNHDLYVDLGGVVGRIPYHQTAVGIAEGTVRDVAVISRVGKYVFCTVTGTELAENGQIRPVLSRAAVQKRCYDSYIEKLTPGDVIPAKVTHLESFGAFCDIGCGIISLIPIDGISVSRISHPKDRFYVGENIFAVVKSVEGKRICLTHKELLGTWEQNAALFSVGQTVSGVIRSIEPYGVFVELTPNLAGLAEKREDLQVGMQASVYIKNIIPEKMKVKLVLVDAFVSQENRLPQFDYFLTGGHIDRFAYAPDVCGRKTETVFAAKEEPFV